MFSGLQVLVHLAKADYDRARLLCFLSQQQPRESPPPEHPRDKQERLGEEASSWSPKYQQPCRQCPAGILMSVNTLLTVFKHPAF
jgi:hypothetical protein